MAKKKPTRPWMPGCIVFHPTLADTTIVLRYAVHAQTPTIHCLASQWRVSDVTDAIIRDMMTNEDE